MSTVTGNDKNEELFMELLRSRIHSKIEELPLQALIDLDVHLLDEMPEYPTG